MQISCLDSPEQLLRNDEPTGPELLPIQPVHRHRDGVITFHRKNEEGQFENLFAFRSEHLEGMFPEFRAQLEANAFFSLNSFWSREKNKHYLSAARIRHRTKLRYLCVCYTDLDFYNQGRSFGELLGMIVDLQDRGVIPPASVIVRSGRGTG